MSLEINAFSVFFFSIKEGNNNKIYTHTHIHTNIHKKCVVLLLLVNYIVFFCNCLSLSAVNRRAINKAQMSGTQLQSELHRSLCTYAYVCLHICICPRNDSQLVTPEALDASEGHPNRVYLIYTFNNMSQWSLQDLFVIEVSYL